MFVQTSLCAAAAGTCRMSAMAGMGSADRGSCGQPCRESYFLGGRWDTTPLSWKDRSLIARIPALKEAGVDCLCIGDRDRRVEYVAVYTAQCRTALEDDQAPADADRETVERVFAPNGVAKNSVFERAEPHRARFPTPSVIWSCRRRRCGTPCTAPPARPSAATRWTRR